MYRMSERWQTEILWNTLLGVHPTAQMFESGPGKTCQILDTTPNLIHKISFEMEQSNQSESEFCTYTEVHFDWFSGRQCQLWDSKMLIDIVQASSYLGQIVKREKKSKFVVAGETPVGGFNP